MADITALLAGAAKTNANFNFDELGKSYWGGLEEAYKKRNRDVFQDPSLYDANGNLDLKKAGVAALKAGGLGGVEPVSKLVDIGLQQQRYGNAPEAERLLGGGGQAAPGGFPPSTSQNGAPRQAASDLTAPKPNTGQQVAGGGDQKNSIIDFLTGNGVPPDRQGTVAVALSRELGGVDPNAPLNLNDQRTRAILKKHQMAIRQQGQPPVQPVPPPQAAPQPAAMPPPQLSPNAAVADRFPAPDQQMPLTVPQQVPPQTMAQAQPPAAPAPAPVQARPVQTERITPERAAKQRQLNELYAAAARPQIPEVLKALHDKIQFLEKELSPTEKEKEAAARGMTLDQMREEERQQKQEDEFTKSVDVPTFKDSLEKGKGAKDEIRAYQNAKAQLNNPGGIFSGAQAGNLLEMSRYAAKFLGVDNVESRITNTDNFRSIMSSGVLQTVKQLGTGSGITNADVKFAENMIGKNIDVDENSIRRIVHLAEKVARRRIYDHNNMVDNMAKRNKAIDARKDEYKIDPPPLKVTVGRKISVGDVFDGREYLGGPINNKKSWSDLDPDVGPDTWRAR